MKTLSLATVRLRRDSANEKRRRTRRRAHFCGNERNDTSAMNRLPLLFQSYQLLVITVLTGEWD